MPSVASADPVDSDSLFVLEADVTASPVPDEDKSAPMMRAAASGSISTPYVSIFSEARVYMFTGEKYTNDYINFYSQPFYANIKSVDDSSTASYGRTHIASSVLFYESFSYSESADYFRLHFSIENDIVTFNAQADNIIKLFFVSDQGFGVYTTMSFDPVSKDFYCKIPTSYLASDGYFYVEASGYFRQESVKCHRYDRFVNLSINDFIIPSPVLPDSLTVGSLNDWIYIDRSKCRDFPDGSAPSASPDPSGGGTGGGTGGGGSTPATSDPALGEIKDSINSQKEQDAQQHEETKGLLGRIIDGITSIPGKIIELLTDALKALFIPSEDFLNTKLKSFQDDLDNMGFLAWPVSASIDFLELLLNASGSSGEITLPAAKFNMDGKTITIWEETTFNFADLKSGVPVLFDTLNILFGLLMLVLVCQRAYNMWGKYFGQEPADVFSAIDVGDIAD